MPRFDRYIGIDYSGAGTPDASLKGLRVFEATDAMGPIEVPPPVGPRRHWTRQGLAAWLEAQVAEGTPTLIGIDHAFSFPEAYFARHRLTRDWDAFLGDFCAHWPTDSADTTVGSVREGAIGQGVARTGDPTWLRLTERWTVAAKSVFQFDVQGQVATSTHAGLPWLRQLRQNQADNLHCWPFDGWEVPAESSMIAEVYPSLWMRRHDRENRDGDQHAAYAATAWLQRADCGGSLPQFLEPELIRRERAQAAYEGWILGVV